MKAGIVGGGIMGQLLALALMNVGWHVTIFSDDSKANCSSAAAGLLTPIAELEKNDFMIFQLGMESLQQWPAIIAQLDHDIYFRQLGSLILAHPNDHSNLTRFIKLILAKLPSFNGNLLSGYDIKKLEPEISTRMSGYYFSCEGQIDNQRLLLVMRAYLESQQITWSVNSLVLAIQPGKIILPNKIAYFDLVADCRGLGAKNLFADLRAVRGELVWLYAPEVTIQRPIRFLHPRYSLYIVPRPDNIYLIGASEIESEDYSAISVRTLLELLTAAYCLHPGFIEARVIKTVTHCRPTLPDHLPKIKYANNFIAINGLYRHGFLIAPALVNDIMRWVEYGLSAVHYLQLFEHYEVAT